MPGNWIDAHCHLSDPRIAAGLDALVEECGHAGIGGFVLGGVDPADWDRQRELARRFPGRFHPVFGLHPWWVHDLAAGHREPEAWRPRLEEALARLRTALPESCALGETGLDGARDRLKTSRPAQIEAFRAQLGLAQERRKPLVLHVVRAHAEALGILEEPAHRGLGGLIHSFSGTCDDARRYLDLGWTLSVSARLTHPNAFDLRQVVRECPAERLVFETDAPDQPPQGHPGPLHTPLSLLKVVESAARLRNETPEALLDQSRENLVRVLGLPEQSNE